MTAEIWNMHELRPRERVLLALIAGYCKNGGACTMSNAKLGEWLGVTSRQIQKYLSRLVDCNLVFMTHNPQREIRVVSSAAPTNHSSPRDEQKNTHPANKSSQRDEPQFTHIGKNNKMNIKYHNGEKEKIPSVDQATSALRHMVDNVEAFAHVPYGLLSSMAKDCLNYYEANDYRTKRGDEIRRWRPVLENWLRRNAEKMPKRKKPAKEYTLRDMQWHERRSESWRKKADELPLSAERRADWMKYAADERATAQHIKQKILQNAKNADETKSRPLE